MIAAKLSLASFCIGLALSVAAVDLMAGPVPVRAIFILIALALSLFVTWQNISKICRQHKISIFVIAGLAILGLLVSLANGTPLQMIARQVLEIHFQALAGLILISTLICIYGIKPLVFGFLTVWSISAVFALLQFLDINEAWNARALLGDLMVDPAITRMFYENQSRALGLSFTPVHLATQTCLAFAAFMAWRIYQTKGVAFNRLDVPTFMALLIAIIVCVISGNRSPLIGFVVFLAIYLVRISALRSIHAFPVVIVLLFSGPFLLDLWQGSGLRVASTEDGSAIGRAALSYFGFQLFWDQPIGYGLSFDSVNFASRYSHSVIAMDNPEIIKSFSLHNYYLQMLNKYGLFILVVVPLLWPAKKKSWTVWFCFLPYLIHIAFHNDGPLSSDFLFWFVLPLFPTALARMGSDVSPPEIRSSGAGKSIVIKT